MPLIDPNDDMMMNSLIESVPGLEQELLAEAEERGAQVDPEDPYEWVKQSSNELYPVDPLSQDESSELMRLSNRAQRLAPIQGAQFGEVGSARNPGNPYSIDTRGAAQGVRNLVTGIINKVRDKRRSEFEPRLSELAGQRRTNIENQESRNKYLEEMYPEVFKEEQANKRNTEDNRTDKEINEADNARSFAETMADNSTDLALQQMKNQNNLTLQKLRNSGGSGGSGLSVQLMRDFVESSTPEVELIQDQIGQLYKIAADPVQANMWANRQKKKAEQSDDPNNVYTDIDSYIRDLTDRYLELNQQRAKMINEMGQVPGDPSAEGYDGTISVEDIFGNE